MEEEDFEDDFFAEEEEEAKENEDPLEDDEISPEEEGFLKGYEEANEGVKAKEADDWEADTKDDFEE